MMGALLGRWMGWSWEAGILFGLALSVASTVVLLRALEERGLLTSERGRIAIGCLIVEDIAMVLALALLPALGEALGGALEPRAIVTAVGLTVARVAGFVAVMYFIGRRVIPRVLDAVAQERELFRLAVLAIALGVAFGAAKLFGVERSHSILVGYGRVGKIVAAALAKSGAPFIVFESDALRIGELRERGVPFVEGNAASRGMFEQANPGVAIVARAHSDPEIRHLRGLGANTVIMGERLLALEMIAEIERLGPAATS
jgi:hypothetical protein